MKPLKYLLFLALAAALLPCLCLSAAAVDDVYLGVGYATLPDQCLYAKASANSEVLDVVKVDDCVIVVKEAGDYWYKVIYNNQNGYLYADCLDVQTEADVELGYGKINAGVAYLRSGPGTEYSIVSSGFSRNEHYIVGMYNGFYKILKDNATCYIRSDLLNLSEIPYQNEASENEPQFYYMGEQIGEITFEEPEAVAMASPGAYYGPAGTGNLLSGAQSFVGTPYVFGGASPDGFDCSGLVYYILTQMGVSSYRTAADQYQMGYYVDRDELKPGDLVFFSNTYTSGISHVGIYAGSNQFIHAPGEGQVVTYSSLSGYWAKHYHGARRVA